MCAWRVLIAFGSFALRSRCNVWEDLNLDDGIDPPIADGSIPPAELLLLHSRIDADGDGMLSLSETLAFARTMRAVVGQSDARSLIKEIDSNSDGALSIEEYLADYVSGTSVDGTWTGTMDRAFETAKFRAADANGDTVLNLDELVNMLYPEEGHGVSDVIAMAALTSHDKNGDGLLTVHEFHIEGESVDEVLHDVFFKLDCNGDGMLNLEELKPWECGRYSTEQALRELFKASDTNGDRLLTGTELCDARDLIAETESQYLLLEWIEHSEP